MVILTALLCEYLELSPVSPLELLRGFARRLSSYSGTSSSFEQYLELSLNRTTGSVQDACLVAMLCIATASNEVPMEVIESVKVLHTHSGRHVQRVCIDVMHACALLTLMHCSSVNSCQFTTISQSKDTLKRIIASTRTVKPVQWNRAQCSGKNNDDTICSS